MSKVAIVKGERGHEPVFEVLNLIDYKSLLSSFSKVLIKVNFITVKTWDTGATTDPIVVEAIIKKLKEIPVEIFVVESDATMTNADRASEVTGMKKMCESNSVQFLNLRHINEKVEVLIPNGEVLKKIVVPKIVTESAVISAAKLKTHMSTKVTLGMKNMFGLLPDKFKSKYHARGISNVILDINSVLSPTITVIDGFIGMEGVGPVRGEPKKMDLIIAGSDPVATDSVACRVMGFNPHDVSHIRKAYDKGIGKIDEIEVLNEKIEDVYKIFKRR